MNDKDTETVNEEEKVETTSEEGKLNLPILIEPEPIEEKEEVQSPALVTPEHLIERLENAKSQEEVKELVDLFNLTLTKSEMKRALRNDEWLNKALQQAGERIEKTADSVSTQDLLSLINAFRNNVDRGQTEINKVSSQPTIQINNNRNDITVNLGIDNESKENIIDTIKDIFKDINSDNNDAKVSEETKEEEKSTDASSEVIDLTSEGANVSEEDIDRIINSVVSNKESNND